MQLSSIDHGGDGPTLVILHGLFGSARNWSGIARRLAAHHRVVVLDARNHGASPWAETMDYPAMAEDVAAFLAARHLDGAALVGHSMGGKTAMMLALRRPELVRRLIVVDVAPVVYRHSLLPYVRAMQGADLSAATRRAEVEPLLAAGVSEPAIRAFLLQNLVPAADGGFAWRLNLEAIAAAMDTLTGFPAAPPQRAYAGPTLFLAGGRSDYLRPEHEPTIRALFPAAEIETIADAGHWLHAERPEEFLRRVEAFLDRHP